MIEAVIKKKSKRWFSREAYALSESVKEGAI